MCECAQSGRPTLLGFYDRQHVRCWHARVQPQTARAQNLHRFGAVFVLRFFILLRHGYTSGQMGDTHGAVCCVDRLTAGAGGAKHVNAEIFFLDFNINLFGFWQHRNCGGRGMDATAAFSFRYPLHTVHAAFKLQAGNTPLPRIALTISL